MENSISETDYIPEKDITKWFQEYISHYGTDRVILLKGRQSGKTDTAWIYQNMIAKEKLRMTITMINNLIKQINKYEL